jgi:hypothetical protein
VDADELLRHLLTVDDPRLFAFKTAIKQESPTYVGVSSGDGAPLFRIYSVKAKIAEDTGSHTDGYEDLLQNLKSVQAGQVAVLQVNMRSRTFMVFIDAETGRIFGVLSGSRKS